LDSLSQADGFDFNVYVGGKPDPVVLDISIAANLSLAKKSENEQK
jgi:hypothetical protein